MKIFLKAQISEIAESYIFSVESHANQLAVIKTWL